MISQPAYIGRFAPSPTGPLHFGSLVAALASYLDARFHKGKWLVRIEDIDPPREQPGADQSIIQSLERLGFQWDESILYQSSRLEAYHDLLSELRHMEMLFPCTCSRKEIGKVYKGKCNQRQFHSLNAPYAIRLKLGSRSNIEFLDRFRGKVSLNLKHAVGEFVVRRKDGLIAYQLAVVADDEYQDVTHIVRGADLIDSTFRQIYIQKVLGYRTPSYGHVPMITDLSGNKLSKQSHAPELDLGSPQACLISAMRALGQNPPNGLIHLSVVDLLAWGAENWKPDQVGQAPIPANTVMD
jgi:glutamyl-Q tRNA(Asp) synthetase